MVDGHWHEIDIPIPDGLTTAADVQAFLDEQATKLDDPAKKITVVTAQEYQTLSPAKVTGTDPTKAQVLAAAQGVTGGGIGQLYMCHNK